MIAGLLKVLLFYMAFVFIKNVIKGYVTYQGLKKRMQQDAGSDQKDRRSGQSEKKSAQSEVFEAEYRVLDDQK